MASKHIKTSSPSLTIKKMQTIIKYHLKFTMIVIVIIIIIRGKASVGRDVENWNSYIASGNIKWYSCGKEVVILQSGKHST